MLDGEVNLGAGVGVERDVPARMRDGTTLYADVYRPDGPGPHPVILMRTPYDKTKAHGTNYAHPSWYARQGYIVAVQDVRGRFRSEGPFEPFIHEGPDGYDSVEWAAALPGSSGRVGMYGSSYGGATQLLAAVEQPPSLGCIVPAITGSDYYEGWTYRGGALQLAFAAGWAACTLAPDTARRGGDAEAYARLLGQRRQLAGLYGQMPLLEAPFIPHELAPYFADWLRHHTRDEYWRAISIEGRHDRIRVPCLHVGGWYDIFVNGTLANFTALRALGTAPQRLLIGPWLHIPWSRQVGSVNFGAAGNNVVDEAQLAWFDEHLKGRPATGAPAARVFLMGRNVWRDEPAWPPQGARTLTLHLHSGGRANSLSGDGSLSAEPPGSEPPDVYLHDPSGPVPALGGHAGTQLDVVPIGPADQMVAEARNDVLVYTAAPLERDLTVMGPIEVELHAATSARDADWVAQLVDVAPDGGTRNICEGIIRARFRESLERPAPVRPGEVYRYHILLGSTAHVFLAGHRLRLDVMSSRFPHWDVNTGTGNPPGVDRLMDGITATQTVFHEAGHPSRLILSVVPEA